jgi:hypothetical protein
VVRRPSGFGIAAGIAVAAMILVGAVLIAGRGDHSTRPAGGPSPTSPAPTTPEKTTLGTIYRESACPTLDRGACFDPFPPGRYTFHKSNPQITLSVGTGWRNDSAWPGTTTLSRADVPGAVLQVLMDARTAPAGSCDSRTALKGASRTAAGLVTRIAENPDLVTTAPARIHVGELGGYVLDVAPRVGAHVVTCRDGTRGIPLLMSPSRPGIGDGWGFVLPVGQRARIAVADGPIDRTVVVAAIATGGVPDLRAFLQKAQPVIDSITFTPCAHGYTFSQPCEFDPQTASP